MRLVVSARATYRVVQLVSPTTHVSWEVHILSSLLAKRSLAIGTCVPMTIRSPRDRERRKLAGEKALDPCWSAAAASVIADRLAQLLPEAADTVATNCTSFRKLVAESMFGEGLCRRVDPEALLDLYSQGVLEEALGQKNLLGELGGWARILGPFRGIRVTESEVLLQPFSFCLGLKPDTPATDRDRDQNLQAGDSRRPSEAVGGPQTRSDRERLNRAVRVRTTWRWDPKDETRDPDTKHDPNEVSLRLQADRVLGIREDGYVDRIEELVRVFETALVTAQTRQIVMVPWFLSHHVQLLDRRHVPELLRLLEDKKRREYSMVRNTVYALAVIGDERAFEAIKNLIDELLSKAEEEYGDSFHLMVVVPGALGFVARKNDAAYAYLLRACEWEFWDKRVPPAPHEGTKRRRWGYIHSFVTTSIIAVGMSRRCGTDWIDKLVREKPEFARKFWDAIIGADRSIWKREKYGVTPPWTPTSRELRRKRRIEYWQTRRAHELKDLLRPNYVPPAQPIE